MRCVVANWKMNLTKDEAQAFCEDLLGRLAPDFAAEVGIAPPFTLLHQVSDLVRPRGLQVFGQNGQGAYTGEVSMPQLRDAGCSGVLLGHSERRQFFGETDTALAKKVKAAWQWDLLPLLCIGETLEQRDAGQTLEVLGQQLAILVGTEYREPILYGGSVTPESFPELLGIPEVAGGLVGGASLDPRKFAELVKQAG